MIVLAYFIFWNKFDKLNLKQLLYTSMCSSEQPDCIYIFDMYLFCTSVTANT